MGEKLGIYSGKEVVSKLNRAGWTIDRQKGSHVMMVKPDYVYTLSIPQHKELGPGLLRKILKQANISIQEFKSL